MLAIARGLGHEPMVGNMNPNYHVIYEKVAQHGAVRTCRVGIRTMYSISVLANPVLSE